MNAPANGSMSGSGLAAGKWRKLENEQDFLKGMLAGLLASGLGAFAWGVISVALAFQFSGMALAMGFMVGYAVRHFGKGLSRKFSWMAALIALLGCLLGNLFTVIWQVTEVGGYLDLMPDHRLSIGLLWELMVDAFRPYDLLFYLLAIYQAHRLAIRKLSEEDLRV